MRLARRPFISYTSSHFLWYFHVGTFWQFFFFLCYHNHVFQFGLRMKTHAIENPPFYADILWYGKAKLGTSCHANFLLGYEQKTTPNREREKQCTFVFNSSEGVYIGSSRLHTSGSSIPSYTKGMEKNLDEPEVWIKSRWSGGMRAL